MKSAYIRAMDAIYRACLIVASLCLVVITVIIPYGVFTRYVLNSASSWPEPLAVLLMIVLSFTSAIVCYRDFLHIGVGVLPGLLAPPAQRVLGMILDFGMLAMSLFMVVWGLRLSSATWNQSIPEFPVMSVGASYLPIAIGGALTSLFVIERFFTGKFFQDPDAAGEDTISTE